MRRLPFYPVLVLLLIGMGGYLGCDPSTVAPSLNQIGRSADGQPLEMASTMPPRSPATILIGSYNMQRLGPSKMKDAAVMEVLAEVVRQFDILAIQEITDSEGQALPALMQRVNHKGARYNYLISNPVGRRASGYYEQYAFVYDTDRVASGREFCYLVQDAADTLHREPYVGRFETRGANPFSFTLINMHTDPDELMMELDVLANVYVNVRNFEYPQDDILLLGDLNDRPGRLRGLEQIPGLEALIRMPTNTRQSKTLDNILLDRRLTAEFTGRSGVLDLEKALRIQPEEALKISDHFPVWAEFRAAEVTSAGPTLSAFDPPFLR